MLRRNPASRLNLSNNEMRHPGIMALHGDALARLQSSAANTYPDLVRYRARFAELLSVPAEQLLMSAGSDNAYLAVLGALGRPGSQVLTQQPNYSQLFVYADMFGLKVRTVPLTLDSGGFDFDHFRQAVHSLRQYDLVAISNPNGPAGSWWTDRDVLDVVRLAADRGASTLIDEAYAAYGPGGVFAAADLPSSCVVVESMSKSFGFAGGRLAFLRVPDPQTAQRLVTWNVTNPVSQLTMAHGEFLLEHSGEVTTMRHELCAGRRRIAELAESFRLWAPHSWGNFQVVVLGSEEAAARCVGDFATADIAVRDLARFGLPGAIRITTCVGDDLSKVLKIGQEAFANV